MIYTYPDYYKEFKCIADKCESTCCAGWQILVDGESLRRYKNIDSKHNFKSRLDESIDWGERVFKQDECRRCAFLNKQNLCDMYTALGEESLCYTCTTYPRHIEEFENIRETTLSISCPEVARILLSKMDKVRFYEEETDEKEEYDEFFDHLMFGILQDVRAVMIVIMQDRTRDISQRCAMIWSLAEKLQKNVDEGCIFLCEDILEDYVNTIDKNLNNSIVRNIKAKLKRISENPKKQYSRSLKLFKKLYKLEVLMEDWEKQVDEASLTLYGKDEEHYSSLSREFDDWLETNMPNWQIQFEQIVVYFLSTYLCGAVYDGWVAAKTKMSVVSIFYIHEMLMSKWYNNDKKLSFEDMVNVTYRYSRELEHSDINLDELEEALNK